jgi:Tfp pilus assembly protein FimT
MSKQFRSTAGYTIDQMILVIAIIAILVTLVIVSVGWNLINQTTGTKLASQFRQIEDSNGQFYANFRVWPHQSYTAPAVGTAANMAALAGTSGITAWNAAVTSPRNFIPGFAATGLNVSHTFSKSGNTITMDAVTNPFGITGNYLVIQFSAVPFTNATEAETVVDGTTAATANYSTGRIVALTGSNNCVSGGTTGAATTATSSAASVNVCYVANLYQ